MENTRAGNEQRHELSRLSRLAYSVGHVLNDLCASMWFSYLLMFFHFVLKFDNVKAGALLLIGQIVDAVATTFVGFESDRTGNFGFCRYGRRKTWHLLGTICVLCSFPFVFMNCIGCSNSSQWALLFYYAMFVAIFQFGWASVQISHLSLIPDLTTESCERVELNSYRYAFTVVSNVCVYGIAWLFLGMESEELASEQVGPQDNVRFRNIMLCVIGIGFLTSLFFHLIVKEKPHSLQPLHNEVSHASAIAPIASPVNENGNQNHDGLRSITVTVHLEWKDWFRESQFYKIGLLYMATRLYVNLSQVYIPLYLQDTLTLHRKSIAIIPLVVYVSGFITSFLVNISNKKIGPKVTYFVSALIAVGTCTWIYFGKGDHYRFVLIYVVAALIGVATSSMLITSLAITSDLIGHNTSSGAFVFGCMSFLDKLSNGLAVMLIQQFHPCTTCCASCKFYYAEILSFACGGAALLALIALALLAPFKLTAGQRVALIESCDYENQRYGISRNYLSHAESVEGNNVAVN